MSIKRLYSPLASKHVIDSHNPIQLAAISNYKLAQLTFAPPDLDSLRKTAVIKNMLEDVYSNTPAEWLQQMTRWQFFTPESLEEMTQEGLEEIFAQYAQTIDAFRPIKSVPAYDDSLFDDEDEEGDDELWIAEEQDQQQQQQSLPLQPQSTLESPTPTLFSQPNTILTNELPTEARSLLSAEKPLPPLLDDGKQTRRKSCGPQHRLSWTSDTGITSSVVSQNLANEIMSLFDMDFAIDINLDTAPKLPELPFIKPNRRRSTQRQSQDMLTSLLPAFEKIALENSSRPTALIIRSVPQRSSSLRNREGMVSTTTPTTPPSTPPTTPDTVTVASQPPSSLVVEKSISKKKSLMRLASLVTGGGKKGSSKQDLVFPESPESPTPSSISLPHSSTSTVDSGSSTSSWSSEEQQQQSPSPKSQQHRLMKKKRKSVVIKHEETSRLSRSKSAFIRIGLKQKKQHKQTAIRRTSSAKDLSTYQKEEKEESDLMKSTMCASEETIVQSQTSHGFVKRMTSFHWRMKSRNSQKSVQV
ncbi:MAG: hypothetical protein EXX96DRAFT_106979 [Benjaminiella poitrasii]|nr:MAG: hypothetical protein EXX96DRAFT_106979 [Benjaminiella poitrasii]